MFFFSKCLFPCTTHSLSLTLSISLSLISNLSHNFFTITCTAFSCRTHFYCSLYHNHHQHNHHIHPQLTTLTSQLTTIMITITITIANLRSPFTDHWPPFTFHSVRLWSLWSNLNTKFTTAQLTIHLSYKIAKPKICFVTLWRPHFTYSPTSNMQHATI